MHISGDAAYAEKTVRIKFACIRIFSEQQDYCSSFQILWFAVSVKKQH